MRGEDHGHVCSGWSRATMEDQQDKLECGCEVNVQGCTGMLRSTRTTQSRKRNEREHGYAKLLKQWRNNCERTRRRCKCANRNLESIVNEMMADEEPVPVGLGSFSAHDAKMTQDDSDTNNDMSYKDVCAIA